MKLIDMHVVEAIRTLEAQPNGARAKGILWLVAGPGSSKADKARLYRPVDRSLQRLRREKTITYSNKKGWTIL